MQVDPLTLHTHSLTSYHYAGNNPVMMNDPSGALMSTGEVGRYTPGILGNYEDGWTGWSTDFGGVGGPGSNNGSGWGGGSWLKVTKYLSTETEYGRNDDEGNFINDYSEYEYTSETSYMFVADDQTRGSLQFNVNFTYGGLPNPPSTPANLGNTSMDRNKSSISQDSKGNLHIVLAISVKLNGAFLWGFGQKNPGLLYQVTLHELGHVFQLKDVSTSVVGGLSLPYISDQNGLETLLDTYIYMTNQIMNNNSNLEPDATEKGTNRYAPPGYKPPYGQFNPIKF